MEKPRKCKIHVATVLTENWKEKKSLKLKYTRTCSPTQCNFKKNFPNFLKNLFPQVPSYMHE